MARLNEPPIAPQPAAETIETVKRRFLRQNRELAKINSQQSIRIRSLENDCSKILAENLALREQVLAMHNEMESRPAWDQLDAVKQQLEEKMQEMNSLVSGLSKKRRREDDRSRRKSQLLARKKTAEERQFRSGLGLQEVENAMLPTISENNHYPRRTRGADELQALLDAPDSQSPDIGPPPISRFGNDELITFPAGVEPEDQLEVGEDDEPTLSVNLETRKRRRESGPRLNLYNTAAAEEMEESIHVATKPSKTSNKRKFSVQEDESREDAKIESFRYSRRNAPVISLEESSNEESRPSSPERPVLGAKPVNTDPVVSPKKQRSSIREKAEKESLPNPKSRSRPRLSITRLSNQPELPPLQMPEPPQSADIIIDALPPKTPAVEAIISPPTTEPSTQRPETKDTPPPGDLSASDQIGQAGRPGRRARPQVSYKEPSLHTKMRRPDAKLADAVIDRRTSVEPPPSTVKQEPGNGLKLNSVPAVAARHGEEDGEVGSPLRQKLDRREINQEVKFADTEALPEERSTAYKAVSALIKETSTAKRKATETKPLTNGFSTQNAEPGPAAEDASHKEGQPDDEKLAVFDFTDSSPASVPSSTSRPRITDLAKSARNARRHSAMPSTTSRISEDREADKPEGALPSLHKRTVSGTAKSINAPSSVSRAQSTGTSGLTRTKSTTRPVDKEKRLVSTRAPTPSDTIEVKKREASEEKESGARGLATSTLRAERLASRRKSMML